MLQQPDLGGLSRMSLPVKMCVIKAILLPLLSSETSEV